MGLIALVSRTGRTRTVEHALVADDPRIDIGWFLLGSMRIERDLQYAERQKSAFGNAPFTLPEHDRLLAALGTLQPAERKQHLALLHASSEQEVSARRRPIVRAGADGVVRIVQPALDARDTLVMELRTDPRRGATIVQGDSVSLRARSGNQINFSVRVASSGAALTPPERTRIFNAPFLGFLAAARAEGTLRGRPP